MMQKILLWLLLIDGKRFLKKKKLMKNVYYVFI